MSNEWGRPSVKLPAVLVIVVVARLIALAVGAALDRRGPGSWNLAGDLDRPAAAAVATVACAGLLTSGTSGVRRRC